MSAEWAKNGHISLVAAVVPFVLAIILALGVGYFFTGLQGFTWSVPGVMAYGGGFAVEAAKAFWGGARWHFVAALVGALLLSTISIAAQVLYLELDALKGETHRESTRKRSAGSNTGGANPLHDAERLRKALRVSRQQFLRPPP